MKNEFDLSGKRTEYLKIGRKLVAVIYRRNTLERWALCPENATPPDRSTLAEYSVILKKITELGQELSKTEQETGSKLGALALLGVEPSLPIRISLVLLLAKALCYSVTSQVNTVGALAEFAVGTQSPDDLLTVRQGFRQEVGCLRPHCEIVMKATLDQCRVSLSERAFSVVLGLPANETVEFDVLAERL